MAGLSLERQPTGHALPRLRLSFAVALGNASFPNLCFRILRAGEVELRERVHSQVELGNEGQRGARTRVRGNLTLPEKSAAPTLLVRLSRAGAIAFRGRFAKRGFRALGVRSYHEGDLRNCQLTFAGFSKMHDFGNNIFPVFFATARSGRRAEYLSFASSDDGATEIDAENLMVRRILPLFSRPKTRRAAERGIRPTPGAPRSARGVPAIPAAAVRR